MPYPQTFLGIQDSVLSKLRMNPDGTLNGTTNRDRAKDWINEAYAQAAIETQALQEAGAAAVAADEPTYTLPAKIIELKWVIIRGVSDTAFGPPLRRVALEQILEWRNGTASQPVYSTGSSGAYALIGLNQLELYPTPTAADTIQFYYSYLPDPLTADGDIPVFQEPWGSKIIEYGALAQAAEMQADPLGPTWDAKYQDWKTRLRVHMNRRGGVVDYFPLPMSVPTPRDPSADIGAYN